MLLTDLPAVPMTAAAFWLLPSGHSLHIAAAAVAVCAYAAGLVVRFPTSRGHVIATQPAFVVLLFAVPYNVVPAVAMAARLVIALLRSRRPRTFARTLMITFGDSYHVLPPAVILSLAATGPGRWSLWPAYAAAFGAQFASDAGTGALREAAVGSTLPLSAVAQVVGLDALLTPVGLVIAQTAQRSAGGAAAALVGVTGTLVLGNAERTSRLRHEHRSLHDPLTELANRALLLAMLDSAIRRAERTGTTGAVILADLDGFKPVNDEWGHALGDDVLRAVADRMTAAVRRSDLVARPGGDEFAVLLSPEDGDTDAEFVAAKLRAAVEAPIELTTTDGRHVRVTVGLSTGVAGFAGGDETVRVLAHADRAMYADKRARGRSVR